MGTTTDFIRLTADGEPMQAFVARPERPGAGLLVIQEAFGVNAHIRDVVQRYAALGFTAIAPEMFHRTAPPGFEASYGDFDALRPHMSGLSTDGMVEDMRAAYEWLLGEAKVPQDRIAAVGYCMGGRCAYIANAAFPLAAAISYYGGGIAPDLLDRAPKQHGPILMFWGGLDKHIPPEQYRAVADALTAAGKDHVQTVFSQADHGFNCDARPSFSANASRQALALGLEFLRVHGVL
jgi:carboxymethylenebutenolidase